MALYRVRDGEHHRIATDVELATTWLAQTRGCMFRRLLPDEYALVFDFDETAPRTVHMLFVVVPLDVVWVVGGDVVRTERLSPWTGVARHRADTLVELPAGQGGDVAVGDRLMLTGT